MSNLLGDIPTDSLGKIDIEKAGLDVMARFVGPPYNYANRIPDPEKCKVTEDGSLNALLTDTFALGTYADTLTWGRKVFGQGGPSQSPLGLNYFIESGICNKESSPECAGKTRFLYIQNVPTGNVECTDQLGIKLPNTGLRGLVPGLITDTVQINPVQIFNSLAGKGGGITGPCTLQKKGVGSYDDMQNGKTETRCSPIDETIKCFPDIAVSKLKERFVDLKKLNSYENMIKNNKKKYLMMNKKKDNENRYILIIIMIIMIVILLFIIYKKK